MFLSLFPVTANEQPNLVSNTGEVKMASMIYFSLITLSINHVFIYLLCANVEPKSL